MHFTDVPQNILIPNGFKTHEKEGKKIVAIGHKHVEGEKIMESLN